MIGEVIARRVIPADAAGLVFNGSHLGLDEVVFERGRAVTIRGDAGTAYADGERTGPPRLVCEVVPKAVEMLELTS